MRLGTLVTCRPFDIGVIAPPNLSLASLSSHHQIWVHSYIQFLANVFEKHKLNICAAIDIDM